MELIYLKEVDKSVLYEGFTIQATYLESFFDLFGKLELGKKHEITVILNGHIYSNIWVINQNFNRRKYPDHTEMYQVRYNGAKDFIQALRAEFMELYEFIAEQMEIKKAQKEQGIRTHNIKIPEELRCTLAFYTTSNPYVWEAVPVTSDDYLEAKNQLTQWNISEKSFEDLLLTDNDATVIQERHLVKVRKLDRNVCLNLKKIYHYRCQICGQNISVSYGNKPVVDAHHIDFFTRSLNNNFNNVMILCPNHHRIIHTYQPVYKKQSKVFEYDNGYKEGLTLNYHL